MILHNPQTFAFKADRERFTPAALEAVNNIAKIWKLSGEEAAALLGCLPAQGIESAPANGIRH
jgi:hypothetical protein